MTFSQILYKSYFNIERVLRCIIYLLLFKSLSTCIYSILTVMEASSNHKEIYLTLKCSLKYALDLEKKNSMVCTKNVCKLNIFDLS